MCALIRGDAGLPVSSTQLGKPDATARQVGLALLSRSVALPLAAACSIATARLVVASVGITGYGLVSIVAALPALLAFSDLGVGAAVTNARALAVDEVNLHDTVAAALRVLCAVAAAVTAVSAGLAVAGAWPTLLGMPASMTPSWAVALAVSLFALSLPLAIGQRVLLGAGRNHTSILILSLVPPGILACVLVGHVAGAPLSFYVCVPSAVAAIAACTTCWVAARSDGLRLMSGLRRALNPNVKLVPIGKTAGPMAAIAVSLPLAYQTDRLIVSHVVGAEGLAQYSAGALLFAPALALISSGGMSLWPAFMRLGATNPQLLKREYRRAQAAFTLLGACLAVGLLLVGPLVGTWMMHGEVTVSATLMGSFALLVLVHATYYPSGMLLMDERGLRLQAVTSGTMAVVNVAASIWLAGLIGPSGPVVASAAAIGICMWVPGYLAARRRVEDSLAGGAR
jgi:O-antigen/teichoic acid export membrane protein